MFTCAVETEQLAINPVRGIKELVEEPTRQIDAWPMPAIHAVAVAASKLGERLPDFQRSQQAPWAAERDYTIILLAALTGLRQSELFALRWEQIDEHWIHVTHKLCRRSYTRRETKTWRGRRRVPILDAARRLLAAWREVGAHDEIVFPCHGGSDYIRASHFDNKVWSKARKATKRSATPGVSIPRWRCRR
jgi:integrase